MYHVRYEVIVFGIDTIKLLEKHIIFLRLFLRKRNLQSFLLKGIDRGSQSVNNITIFIYSEAFADNERCITS